MIGVPPPGGVIVAATVPVCEAAEVFVTSVLTVSAELLRFAAVFWSTCALPTISGPPVWSWTGNWMPVLLSGGIWLQSTLSSVSILVGSFGCISIASEFVPARSRLVMSKTFFAYAPVTVRGRRVPFTQTSACPITPLRISFASEPAGAAKSVRYHHGTENCAIVSAPTFVICPKQDFMFVEKKTFGQLPFCSRALISVPGAPAPSLATDSQPEVENPGVEICAPVCVAVALVSTFQPPPPRSVTALDPVGSLFLDRDCDRDLRDEGRRGPFG